MNGENVRSIQRGIVTVRRCWSNSPFSCLNVLAQTFGSESLCCSSACCCCWERVTERFCRAVAVDTLQYILLLFDDITFHPIRYKCFKRFADSHNSTLCTFHLKYQNLGKQNRQIRVARTEQVHRFFVSVWLVFDHCFDRFPTHWLHLQSPCNKEVASGYLAIIPSRS